MARWVRCAAYACSPPSISRRWRSAASAISYCATAPSAVVLTVWPSGTQCLDRIYDWLESANKEAAKLEAQANSYIDGSGNEVKVEKAKKKASLQ